MAPLTTVLILSLVGITLGIPQQIFVCREEGRFPDPEDCTGYYTCMPRGSHDRTLQLSKGTCNNMAFDPVKNACVSINKVEGCKPKRSARQMIADPRYNSLCTKDEFTCLDCKNVINCIDRKAYHTDACGDGFTCQKPDAFKGSATCYHKEEDTTECKCTMPNTFKTDPHNGHGFIFCALADSDPSVHRCPGDMKFDTKMLDCVNEDGVPSCRESGVFANPKNCSQYYTCIQTVGEIVQKVFECDSGKMYNENEKECSDPCSWPSTHFRCTKEGRFPDPKDCHNFMTCVRDSNQEGNFILTSRKCPKDYVWDPKAKSGLGHCVNPNSYKSCKPVLDNICQRPDTCDESSIPVTTGEAETTEVAEATETAEVTEATEETEEAEETEESSDSTITNEVTSNEDSNARFANIPLDVMPENVDSIDNVLEILRSSVQ